MVTFVKGSESVPKNFLDYIRVRSVMSVLLAGGRGCKHNIYNTVLASSQRNDAQARPSLPSHQQGILIGRIGNLDFRSEPR